MSLKIKPSPINIVPFIDVLLVLFVIMIVVARFDPVTPPLQPQEQAQKTSQKSEIISTPKIHDQSKKVAEMAKKIEQLKKQLEEASKHKEDHKEDHKKDHDKDHNSEAITVMFGPLGLIKIGNTEISEQSLKDIIKIVQPGVSWDVRKGGEDTKERMDRYIHSLGYSYN